MTNDIVLAVAEWVDASKADSEMAERICKYPWTFQGNRKGNHHAGFKSLPASTHKEDGMLNIKRIDTFIVTSDKPKTGNQVCDEVETLFNVTPIEYSIDKESDVICVYTVKAFKEQP